MQWQLEDAIAKLKIASQRVGEADIDASPNEQSEQEELYD